MDISKSLNSQFFSFWIFLLSRLKSGQRPLSSSSSVLQKFDYRPQPSLTAPIISNRLQLSLSGLTLIRISCAAGAPKEPLWIQAREIVPVNHMWWWFHADWCSTVPTGPSHEAQPLRLPPDMNPPSGARFIWRWDSERGGGPGTAFWSGHGLD